MLSVPYLAEDRLRALEDAIRADLLYTVASGERAPGVEPITNAKAQQLVTTFFATHRVSLAEATLDFLSALAHGAVGSGVPLDPATLRGTSPGQLAELVKVDAARATAIRQEIVDRRTALLDALAATGTALLRGAIAAGLQLVLPGGGAALGAVAAGVRAAAAEPAETGRGGPPAPATGT